MSRDYLVEQLTSIKNSKRDNRQRIVKLILKNMNLFPFLVVLTFEVNNRLSIKAAWVLEWICTHNHLKFIVPHLNTFTTHIDKLKFDSAIRPCAKICECLAIAYTDEKVKEEENSMRVFLKESHIKAIIKTGFNWLTSPQKVAVRAYTMQTLFLFGLTRVWVHPELEYLIRKKIIHESQGCKARGRHILAAIEKLKNLK